MGILTTLFAGPLAGLLGSIISGIGSYMERRQQIEADERRFKHEVELQKLNISARGAELEQEAVIAQAEATAAMLADSYQHDASYGPVTGWAATALRFVRPVLTIMLVVMTGLIYFSVADGATITIGDDTLTIREKVVVSVLFMTEAALTWWFADRRKGNK